MRRVSLVAMLVIGTLIFTLEAFSWGIDALVYDGPVTCFDVDYSTDGKLFVVFQKDQSPEYPICCVYSDDRGRTWQELWCLDIADWRLQKLKAFVGEYGGKETIFVFYIDSDDSPSMLRVQGSESEVALVDQGQVGRYRTAPAEFDVARSYHVELGIPWPLDPLPELEESYEFSIVFMWRDLYAGDVYFFRSIDFGETWNFVHVVMSDPMGDTAGLAITWGPPDTYYYVYKGFCGTFCCRSDSSSYDDWRANPGCYAPYWGSGHANGYPGMWTAGRLVQNPDASDDPSDRDRTPDNYQTPVLAASFDPDDPALWLAFSDSSWGAPGGRYWTWSPPDDEGTGWRFRMPRGGSEPENYIGDIKGYRELGNPYLNMAEVSPEYYDGMTPSEWLCIQWRWESATASFDDTRPIMPQVRCANAYNTIPLFSPATPKLLYSPGSDPGGAGIVYLGYELAQDPEHSEERTPRPGLFFDAPWFYPVDVFDSPAEPYPFEPPDSEESEHPMMYVPEAEPLDAEFDAVATPVCREGASHVIAVTWRVAGSSTGLVVTIEIEGTHGILATYESDAPDGSCLLEVDVPGGGSVTVTVTVRDVAGMFVTARSLSLPPC